MRGPSSLPGPPIDLLKTPTSNLGTNGGSQHPNKRKQGGHGPSLADEVEWLLPTPKASDGIKGSPNQCYGSGDLTLPSAAASLWSASRTNDTGAPGRRPGKSDRPPSSAVVLPLWDDPDPGSNQSPVSGGGTQRPSPDGRTSPGRHQLRPTTQGAFNQLSWNGCKGSLRAG
ncbi:hypothetical protein [Streptomyces sp. RPT161]|uniref:hypothetical protein n=1 Tax=Streptomyces sp. RPT161 TaxID=3015993 RepID=UPI0022B8D9D3|nr:hypothetical protein [Streptomyces sp. RPT161]